MKTLAQTPLPPHISMDSYVTFVEESFRAQTPRNIHRQKEIEERIEKAFDMSERREGQPLPRVPVVLPPDDHHTAMGTKHSRYKIRAKD